MDNNPGDSSSESDISDPWSLVDRDSCDETAGVNSVVGSVCGELSDGESLEVIDEESHHDCEFQDIGVDADRVSIVTESEINEELDSTVPLAVSKEKKYLHHPNTYLNTRLNVLLALSFAAVTGLGLGHFLGLQEECPLLEASMTAQLAKLQEENKVLQKRLDELLRVQNLGLRSEPQLGNNGINLHFKELPSEPGNDGEHLTHETPVKIIQNDRDDKINNNFMEASTVLHIDTGNENLGGDPVMKVEDILEDINVIDIDSEENEGDTVLVFEDVDNIIETSSGNGMFIQPANNENLIISEENHISPEENLIDENIDTIKSTLGVLKTHFNKDVDTVSIMSSAASLAVEHEQSLMQLQKAITECKIRNNNFCVHFHKRLETSASKLRETSEQLVDDIDDQIHKLLTRIVRKLKKIKKNVQNKWCHLKNDHDGTNDWLQSSMLMDCKNNNEKHYFSKPKNRENPVKKHNLEKISEQNKHRMKHFKKDKINRKDNSQNNYKLKTWDKKKTEKENSHNYVIVDEQKAWPKLNIALPNQNNVTGEWVLKLGDGRAEQRKLSHKSDWLFDRADSRKEKRGKYQMTDDWYFQRARGREDCRHSSNSDWCKDRSWNHPSKERKLPRWSKKFAQTFAETGKWVKDSFSRFGQKMNY